MLHNFVSVYGVIEREELCRLCSEEGLYGSGPREAMEESLRAMGTSERSSLLRREEQSL